MAGPVSQLDSSGLSNKRSFKTSLPIRIFLFFHKAIRSELDALHRDFFSWNKVKIRYCDGASFAGHPESEFKNGTKLFFRGQLIWEAIKDELLSVGLSNAKQVVERSGAKCYFPSVTPQGGCKPSLQTGANF